MLDEEYQGYSRAANFCKELGKKRHKRCPILWSNPLSVHKWVPMNSLKRKSGFSTSRGRANDKRGFSKFVSEKVVPQIPANKDCIGVMRHQYWNLLRGTSDCASVHAQF